MIRKALTFDMAVHLDRPEAITEYLNQVLADGDIDELLRALGHVARARGMAQVALMPAWAAKACTRHWHRAPSRGPKPCSG